MNCIIKFYNASDIVGLMSEYNIIEYTVYENIPGLVACVLEMTQIQQLKQDTRIAYIKRGDSKVVQTRVEQPDSIAVKGQPVTGAIANLTRTLAQTAWHPSLWHLGYTMRAHPSTDGSVDERYTTTKTGNGVDVYVVDSGIRYSHTDFLDYATQYTSSRAMPLPGYTDPFDNNGEDGDGHGTHVAAIVGGVYSGFAKDVRLYSARVFSDVGQWCGDAKFVDACDKIIAHHISKNGSRPSVVNMSLGTDLIEYEASATEYRLYVEADDPFNASDYPTGDVVRALVGAGITVVVSAGNGWASERFIGQQAGINAALVSPARVAECITVGSLTKQSAISSFSNYGKTVDIFAPGSSILSAAITDGMGNPSDEYYVTMSGTSMAAPCVTGMCALYLESNPTATPNDVINWVRTNAANNTITRTNLGGVTSTDPIYQHNLTSELYALDSMFNETPIPYPPDNQTPDCVLHNPFRLKTSAG